MSAPRRRARGLGLRGKLVLVSLLVVSIPLLVVWSIGLYEGLEHRRSAAQLREAGRTIVAELEQRSGAGGRLERLAEQHGVLARIVGRGGAVLTRTDPSHGDRWANVRGWFRRAGDFFFGPAGPPDLLAFEATLPEEHRRREVRAAMSGEATEAVRRSADGRLVVYYRALPMPGGGALYLTRYSRRNIRALYGARYAMLKLTLILAAVSAVMGLWVGWRLVRPLVQLQGRVARHLERGGEGPAGLALERADEIGSLARHVNVLAERLGRRARRSSEAAADLAHRIKSPISTVSATAEMLGEAEDERSRRLARALGEASSSLSLAVDGMLRLTKVEEALATEERRAVELQRLVEVVHQRALVDPARGEIEVRLTLPPERSRGHAPLEVWGIEEQLSAALSALIDNALAFARGQVELLVVANEDSVVLSVADDGPGVSAGHRERIFERYFTGRAEQGGTGLGLAIVAAVAEAHGGEAALAESRLKGACFTLRLPRLRAAT